MRLTARQQAASDRWSIEFFVACVFCKLTLPSSYRQFPCERLFCTAQIQKEHVLKHVLRLFLLYFSKMKVRTGTPLVVACLLRFSCQLSKHLLLGCQGGSDTHAPVPPVLDIFWSWCATLQLKAFPARIKPQLTRYPMPGLAHFLGYCLSEA